MKISERKEFSWVSDWTVFYTPGSGGMNSHEYVKERFLITRNLKRYLLLFHILSHPGERIIYFDKDAPPLPITG